MTTISDPRLQELYTAVLIGASNFTLDPPTHGAQFDTAEQAFILALNERLLEHSRFTEVRASLEAKLAAVEKMAEALATFEKHNLFGDHMTACDKTMGASHPCTCHVRDLIVARTAYLAAIGPLPPVVANVDRK